jgi:hypothetical protein
LTMPSSQVLSSGGSVVLGATGRDWSMRPSMTPM